jgi:predicted dehydrogenase
LRRAGKHIICEKPLARTLDQGAAILDVVARAGVKLAVGHVVRYFPDYALAHDLVVRGEIGAPGVARATRGAGFPTVPGDWFSDVARSGGVALDLMIHDFDWLRWTFGLLERLYARGLTYAGHPRKDAAMVVARFRGGARALRQMAGAAGRNLGWRRGARR